MQKIQPESEKAEFTALNSRSNYFFLCISLLSLPTGTVAVFQMFQGI